MNGYLVTYHWRGARGVFLINESDETAVPRVAQLAFEKITGYKGVPLLDEDNPAGEITALSSLPVFNLKELS